MKTRPLGNTGLDLPVLGFGASSLGQEFRQVRLDEALQAVHTALDLGINLIDSSPFYGRGMSEVLLGVALRDVPRESYQLCTKLGRYTDRHFDFSAGRVEESIHTSLHRLGTDHIDILLLHDVEYVELPQVWEETIPAALKAKEQGKVRAVGFSCYPLKTFHKVLDHAEDVLDCILCYNRYTLQNTTLVDDLLPRLKAKGIGVMNAGPFSARLLTHTGAPDWVMEPEEVKEAARKASRLCDERGTDIAKLALQYSCDHPDLATCIAGSANPANVRKWAEWLDAPIDKALLEEILSIFEPVRNIGHESGLPENN
jgi:aryl-alcohol dehydrogenase-like predicted oxidoreductase